MSTISVIVHDDEKKGDGTLGSGRKNKGVVKAVDLNKLSESIKTLSGQITKILDEVPDNTRIKLDEVKIFAEISASGGLNILGVNSEFGINGGISFTFKR